MKTTHARISLLWRAALAGCLLLLVATGLVSATRTANGQESPQSPGSAAKQKAEPPLPPQEAIYKGKIRPAQNSVPRPKAAGGPDAYGYRFITNQPPAPTVPYNFIDISATGTVLGSGDDVSYTAPLGAPFNFYGTSYNALQVSTNGYISTDLTDLGSDFTNDCPLPAPPSSGGGGRIYPLHGDLVLNPPTGRILQRFFPVCPRANDVGGAAEACTVIMWDNAEFFSAPGTFDFEVILYHTTAEIVVQVVSDPDTGTNTTTGIQNPAATSGLTVACNSTGSIPNTFAVAFIPPCSMITCPANVTVNTNATSAVVNYPAPTGSPACGPITCTPPSGSVFPQGTTAVTCAATGAPGTPSCSFNVTVIGPNIGPGAFYPETAEVSDQKAGSVLIYNYFTSDVSSPATNTRISLTNINPNAPVAVHLFFIDGATCSVADAFVCLTQNQTVSLLASDYDPGTSGYVVAVATSTVTGCPISFNFLIGDEFVKTGGGFAANLGAEAVAAIAGGLPRCDDTSSTAVLTFNGVSYNRLPRVLAADNLPANASGNQTQLVINRIGGDLSTGADRLGTLFGVLYDDLEQSYSFQLTGGVCQLRGVISGSFPRTVPRIDQIIPAGRSGWLKLYDNSSANAAILGAQLVNNANIAASPNAFRGGHNLHKLTLAPTTSLTIPVFPPRCP